MVHAGEYSEPVSYTARSDGYFRVTDPGNIDRRRDSKCRVHLLPSIAR